MAGRVENIHEVRLVPDIGHDEGDGGSLDADAPLPLGEERVGVAQVAPLLGLEVGVGLLHQTVHERRLTVVEVAAERHVTD